MIKWKSKRSWNDKIQKAHFGDQMAFIKSFFQQLFKGLFSPVCLAGQQVRGTGERGEHAVPSLNRDLPSC